MGISEKRRAFRALHQSGCFVIPNPWNVGSARYLQGLGFKVAQNKPLGVVVINRVQSQSVSPNTMQPKGSTITLYVV